MDVKYRIISGSIELDVKQPLHIDVFPVRNKYFKFFLILLLPFILESYRNGRSFLI